MEISYDLQNCLRNSKVQYLINNNDYNQLYPYIISSRVIKLYPTVGELTQLILSADINPLDYMDYIPECYLAWTGISSFKIPQHIAIIDKYAFAYCKSLKSIIIPDNVTQIGSHAFDNCVSLTSLTLGKNLKKISASALEFTEIKNINYNNSMENWRKIAIDKPDTKLFRSIIHCIDGILKYNKQIESWEEIN